MSEPTYSSRGFAHWDPINASYGSEIDVYESSAAAAPHLWVSITGDCHLTATPREHPGVPFGIASGNSAAHLSMDQTRELIAKLQAAVEHSERRFA